MLRLRELGWDRDNIGPHRNGVGMGVSIAARRNVVGWS